MKSYITFQWRIQSWSEGGFPKVANVSGRSGSVPVTVRVTPLIKKNHGRGGGGGSGQPENPGYDTAFIAKIFTRQAGLNILIHFFRIMA